MNLALNGAIGADTLTGGAANDVFAGGLGSDSLTGGSGNDIFAYTVAGDIGAGEVISGGEGTDTIRQNDNGATATTNDFSSATVTSIEALDLLSDTANNTVIFSVSQLPANMLITESTASATESIVQLNAQPGTNDLSGYTFGANRANGVSLTNAGSNAAFSVTSTGTSKPDTITGGSNDDTITGGNGADSLIGGAGNDVIILGETAASIDEIQLSSTTGSDTITGFTVGTGGDQIDITTTVASAPITGAGNAAISGATATSLAEVTAATTLTTQNIIVLSGATYATSALAEAAIEANGGRALTFPNAPTANDDIFVVWSDGSNSYLGVYNLSSNATTPAAAGVMTTLATIVGVNASVAGTLVAANFDFV
jgi:Ca2+-binding RTX toxin-like protein